MLLVYRLNLEVDAVAPSQNYLGYSSAWLKNIKQRDKEKEDERLQDEAQKEQDQKDRVIQALQAAAKTASDKASRRAMQRSINEALKASQYQALLEFKEQLIANQILQDDLLQQIIDDQNDALIALLLTI